MSCPYHKGEYIEVLGVVGGFIKIYKPPGFPRTIYQVPILWIKRFNIPELQSAQTAFPRLKVVTDNLLKEAVAKTTKTYVFHEVADPNKKTILNNGEPKTGDRVKMHLTPVNDKPDQKHFCIKEMWIL